MVSSAVGLDPYRTAEHLGVNLADSPVQGGATQELWAEGHRPCLSQSWNCAVVRRAPAEQDPFCSAVPVIGAVFNPIPP